MCARSRSSCPRQANPASGSRQEAHVGIVRRPDPRATPETVRHGRPAHNAHVRVGRALPSTSQGDEHLRRDDGLRVHALLHRATLPETAGSSHPDRPDCPWHTARSVSGCDRPGQWHNQPESSDIPRRGHARVCGGVRLRSKHPTTGKGEHVPLIRSTAVLSALLMLPVVSVAQGRKRSEPGVANSLGRSRRKLGRPAALVLTYPRELRSAQVAGV